MPWQADPFHTQVAFSVKHLGMMSVRGHFSEVSVTGAIDPTAPERSAIEVIVQMASIKTHNEYRDKDLLSSNFLEETSPPYPRRAAAGFRLFGTRFIILTSFRFVRKRRQTLVPTPEVLPFRQAIPTP